MAESAESLSMGIWRWGWLTRDCKWHRAFAQPYVRDPATSSALPFPPHRLRPQGLKTHTVITSIGGSLVHLRQIEPGHPTNRNITRSLSVNDACLFPSLFLVTFACLFLRSSIQYISGTYQPRRGQGIFIRPRRFGGPSWGLLGWDHEVITTEVRIHERLSHSTHCIASCSLRSRYRQATELDINGHVIFLCK